MVQLSLIDGLQYAGYAVEFSVLAVLMCGKRIRRFPALGAYVALLFILDAVGRRWVLGHYGLSSRVYLRFYWLTDPLLAFGLFLLVCSFFRRGCSGHPRVWAFVRPALTYILLLVLAISALTLRTNLRELFAIDPRLPTINFQPFVFEFGQDIYFVCLVLNTVLYLMLQRLKNTDEQLELLVCGLGLQFAGPAASFALIRLHQNHADVTRLLAPYLADICTLAMLGVWLYAVARRPEGRSFKGKGRRRSTQIPLSTTPAVLLRSASPHNGYHEDRASGKAGQDTLPVPIEV